MPNMNYCRFENTALDLKDCLDHMDADDLSESDASARKRLIQMCVDIAADYGEEIGLSVEVDDF